MTGTETQQETDIKPQKYYKWARSEMLAFIPEESRVILDVGCGEGVFGASLKQKFNAEVWGIELDNDAAGVAKGRIDKTFAGDISVLIDELPDRYFDCIVFNDVLEHLVDPYTLLAKAKDKLKDHGRVVCSIPNVRHFSVLRNLLFKKQWKYEDAGILDRTHLRFFTKLSIIDMFTSLNYEILSIKGIHPTSSWRFKFFNLMFLGQMADARYAQFACIVKPK